MSTLREKLFQDSNFLIGVELVSTRGGMSERSTIKARDFASELVRFPGVDWISITDNAGGNPQLAPTALGKPILYAGKEVVIHLTCKDLNRNGLESEAWLLHSEGFNNILAMTGDFPVAGSGGAAKPVFDIDSVGLISMLNKMNRGLDPKDGRGQGRNQPLGRTDFLIGAVTTNFKLREGEVMPQYFKLQKKIECGAGFIINQIGFDSRKISELRLYMDTHGMKNSPLIGNVFLLSARVAQIFHEKRIPGVVVSRALLELCQKHGQSPDGGKAFFLELAAKQIAIYRGLGYRGAYLGGVHNFPAIQKILEIAKTFSPDDWKQFAREIRFSRPGEYFYFAENPATGLADRGEAKSRRADCLQARHRDVSIIEVDARHDVRAGHGFCQVGCEDLRPRERFISGAETGARPGKSQQGDFIPLQGLRRLLAAGHRIFVSRIAVRKKPAQRPVRRHARRPLRSGRLWRLHLAARLRTAQARRQGAGTSVPRPGDPGPAVAQHFRLGEQLAGPRSCGKKGRGAS